MVAIPMAAGDNLGYGREALVDLAIIFKAVGQDCHRMNPALEFPGQNGIDHGQAVIGFDVGSFRLSRHILIWDYRARWDESHIGVIGNLHGPLPGPLA